MKKVSKQALTLADDLTTIADAVRLCAVRLEHGIIAPSDAWSVMLKHGLHLQRLGHWGETSGPSTELLEEQEESDGLEDDKTHDDGADRHRENPRAVHALSGADRENSKRLLEQAERHKAQKAKARAAYYRGKRKSPRRRKR